MNKHPAFRAPHAVALVFCGMLGAGSASASDVAVVISRDIVMYQEAAASLEKALPAAAVKTDVFAAESKAAVDETLTRVAAERPKVIVAIGSKAAAESARRFPETPVVYLMVVYPERQGLLELKNAYGVSWQPSAASLVQSIRMTVPGAKRIGMLSSQPRSALADLIEACGNSGLELVVSSIKSASDLPQGLRNLSGKMDLLWMGSDPLLANESAYDLLANFSAQNNIPLLVPFRLTGGKKALAGVSVTPELAGSAAGRLVEQLLQGKKPRRALSFPGDVELTIDSSAARSIGIAIPEAARKSAAKILD